MNKEGSGSCAGGSDKMNKEGSGSCAGGSDKMNKEGSGSCAGGIHDEGCFISSLKTQIDILHSFIILSTRFLLKSNLF